MRYGQLADHFVGVGVKRLTDVDANPKKSNQHEINTTKEMRRDFLGESDKKRFPAVYIWLGEDQDRITVEGRATHYDTRINQVGRTEWRLYYPSNRVTKAMNAGDTLFLARDRADLLLFIVAPQGSTSERQLFWLFGLEPQGETFVSREFIAAEPELDFAARYILDELGIEFEDPEIRKLDGIIKEHVIPEYGTAFPPTAEFSRIARRTIYVPDDPDVALMTWVEHEEALFRRLELRIVDERIRQGFVFRKGYETRTPSSRFSSRLFDLDGEVDVNGFVKFSLSVQNRRKSRMGHSLEHHLAYILESHDVAFERKTVTENNNRPDFLFPSLMAYRAAADGDPSLTMLGAKSTCKERWRQVLTEAAKIPRKHLLTLEPRITENQTDQMKKESLQLVVPARNPCELCGGSTGMALVAARLHRVRSGAAGVCLNRHGHCSGSFRWKR